VLEHAFVCERGRDVFHTLVHAGNHPEDHGLIAVVAGRCERQPVVLRHLQGRVGVLIGHVPAPFKIEISRLAIYKRLVVSAVIAPATCSWVFFTTYD
jgi:hypothetical protein